MRCSSLSYVLVPWMRGTGSRDELLDQGKKDRDDDGRFKSFSEELGSS